MHLPGYVIGELTPGEIEDLLRRQLVGRIGCCADGVVYVVPVNYVYYDHSVYGQTAEGMKTRMMRRQPSVCFEVDEIEGIGIWRSVIAWGTYEELSGDAATEAVDRLVAPFRRIVATEQTGGRYALTTRSIRAAYTAGREEVVYRIRLERTTGRFEQQ